jgi:hypothetical protein
MTVRHVNGTMFAYRDLDRLNRLSTSYATSRCPVEFLPRCAKLASEPKKFERTARLKRPQYIRPPYSNELKT